MITGIIIGVVIVFVIAIASFRGYNK